MAVTHYLRAAAGIGLWRAEEGILAQLFEREQRLLDVGCGAGRIALGLWRLGYRELTGVDFCPAMIEAARALAASVSADIRFEVRDATGLDFGDESFGGAIFGFNGLMQIPGRDRRRRALKELRRAVRSAGFLVFTTHDRSLSSERDRWRDEAIRWHQGTSPPGLVEFGDRVMERPEGMVFMHLPDRSEILDDLAATGWRHQFDELRSRLANESASVREFSDECRFWVAQR